MIQLFRNAERLERILFIELTENVRLGILTDFHILVKMYKLSNNIFLHIISGSLEIVKVLTTSSTIFPFQIAQIPF